MIILLYWRHTPSSKQNQKNDTPIWSGGNASLTPTMHHMCDNTDLLDYDVNSFWACPINCYHHYPCFKDEESCFFVFQWNSWHAFQTCNQVFAPPSPLCNLKWLLEWTILSSLKYWRHTEFRSEFQIKLKKTLIILTQFSSNASILNWNESQSIIFVSKIVMYLSMEFLQISIDIIR